MEAQHVYVNGEPRTTSTFARGVSYIAASVSFTLANFTFVRTEKLRDSGNQPLIFVRKRRGCMDARELNWKTLFWICLTERTTHGQILKPLKILTHTTPDLFPSYLIKASITSSNYK